MALCRYLVSFMFMFACNGRSGRVKWHYVMPFFCWFGMGHSLDFIALYWDTTCNPLDFKFKLCILSSRIANFNFNFD